MRGKLFFPIIFFLLFSSTGLYSQTIFGKVIDDNGQGVDGVKVTQGAFYTLSKSDGTYKLDIQAGKN